MCRTEPACQPRAVAICAAPRARAARIQTHWMRWYSALLLACWSNTAKRSAAPSGNGCGVRMDFSDSCQSTPICDLKEANWYEVVAPAALKGRQNPNTYGRSVQGRGKATGELRP